MDLSSLASYWALQPLDQMPELLFFRPQVFSGTLVRSSLAGHALFDGEPGSFEGFHLGGIVRKTNRPVTGTR